MKWQPIETAPKDGWFWLWLDWRGACIARRSKDSDYDWEFIEHTKAEGKYPIFRVNAIDGNATHWMPLPEPPDVLNLNKGETHGNNNSEA